MVVNITRDKDVLTICPDNIVCIRKSEISGSEYKYACVGSSGDTIHINEQEMEIVRAALRLRDEQLEKLILNTKTIITELNELNNTSNQIETNTADTNNNTGALVGQMRDLNNTSGSILNQSQSNGRILSSIKSVCDNILSWVKTHYPLK